MGSWGLFSPLPSWKVQTHHCLPPPVQIPHALQIFLIFSVQSHWASSPPAFNPSQCVTENESSSQYNPSSLEGQREFITYMILLDCSAIESLICCLTSLEGILLALFSDAHRCSCHWWKLVSFWGRWQWWVGGILPRSLVSSTAFSPGLRASTAGQSGDLTHAGLSMKTLRSIINLNSYWGITLNTHQLFIPQKFINPLRGHKNE